MANKPFSTFEKTLERAQSLLNHFDEGPTLAEKDDLVRAAVIIAVAGFDRYFTAKFCDVLVPHLKSGKAIGDKLFGRLQEAGFDTEFSLRLIAESVENRSARPFRKIRTIVQTSLSNHTTHRDHVINKLFLDLGLKELCQHAERKAKKKTLVKQTMDLVDMRNAIAHEGHVKASGDPRKIDRAKVGKQIEAMESFVKCCDEIIDKRFGIKPALSA